MILQFKNSCFASVLSMEGSEVSLESPGTSSAEATAMDEAKSNQPGSAEECDSWTEE